MQGGESFPIPRGFYFIRNIGMSRMGSTCLVGDSNGTTFVCKEILKEKIGNETRVQYFKERIDHINALGSPFIIPYDNVFEDDVRLCLIRRYFEEGDIFQSHDAMQKLGSNMIFALWKVFARTVYFLHQHHIAPIFIRPSNLFFYNDSCIVITDLYPSNLDYNVMQGTLNPMEIVFFAPEMFTLVPSPNERSDVWGLGMILIFLITGKLPFSSKNLFTMISEICNRTFEIPKTLPDNARNIVDIFVKVNPLERGSIESVLDTKSILPKREKSEGFIPVYRTPNQPPQINMMRKKTSYPTAGTPLRYKMPTYKRKRVLSLSSYMDPVKSSGDLPQLRVRLFPF